MIGSMNFRLRVQTSFYKILAFMLSAFYAGIAGSLYAHFFNYISPDAFTIDQSTVYFTMLVAGGAGNVYGPIIGTVLLTVLPEALRFLKSIYMGVYGLGLVLLMIFLPGGITSLFARKRRSHQQKSD